MGRNNWSAEGEKQVASFIAFIVDLFCVGKWEKGRKERTAEQKYHHQQKLGKRREVVGLEWKKFMGILFCLLLYGDGVNFIAAAASAL